MNICDICNCQLGLIPSLYINIVRSHLFSGKTYQTPTIVGTQHSDLAHWLNTDLNITEWVRKRKSLDIYRNKSQYPCNGALNTAQDFLYGTLWHSNNSRHLLLGKPGNWELFSIVTGRILDGMIDTLVRDGKFHATSSHSWMLSTQMRHIVFGANWESVLPKKKDVRERQKWWSTIKLCITMAS